MTEPEDWQALWRAASADFFADRWEACIEACRRGIRGCPRTGADLWIRFRLRFGSAAIESGDRATIEEAIGTVQEVVAGEASDGWKGRALFNMAMLYRSRRTGRRAENLAEAIARYVDATEFCTLATEPEGWALIKMATAVALAERVDALSDALLASAEEREIAAESLDWAEECCAQALRVFTPSSHPEDHEAVDETRGRIAESRARLGRLGGTEGNR